MNNDAFAEAGGGATRPEPDERPLERPLERLSPGERGLILRIDAEPGITRRLMELGLVPGTEVELIRTAPLGDPLEVAVRGLHLSLRRSEATHIHVSPC